MLLQDTPTEKYHMGYFVKREDLACKPPGPPFAKVRGLWKGLEKLKSLGVRTVGYYETSISMATWGVSCFCKELGMKPVVFYYKYKDGLKHNQPKQQQIWEYFGAEVHINKNPNMQKLHEAVSRKKFEEMYPGPEGFFLPAGLKFDYTIEEVAKQVKLVPKEALGGTIVICSGSGMMTAGVLRGLEDLGIRQDVTGVIIHPKSKNNLREFILKKSGIMDPYLIMSFRVVDYGFEYTQKLDFYAPFPCCPYYDLKAYKYMIDNLNKLKKPILFWNIGSGYALYDDFSFLKLY